MPTAVIKTGTNHFTGPAMTISRHRRQQRRRINNMRRGEPVNGNITLGAATTIRITAR